MYSSDVKCSSCTDGPVIWFAVTPQQKVPKICFHGWMRVSEWPHLWISCFSNSISEENHLVGESNVRLELLVFREPDTEFYTCNAISFVKEPGQFARDKGTDQICKGFSTLSSHQHQRDGISLRRLYLDGAQPRWLCYGPNRQYVLMVCYLSFARIYRFLWDLLKTHRSVTLRSGNRRWYSSTTARACRGGYKCNVCRHIVQWIRWPLISIAGCLNTKLWPVNTRKQNYWHSTSNNRFCDPVRSIPPTGRCGGDPIQHRHGPRCSLPPILGSSFICVAVGFPTDTCLLENFNTNWAQENVIEMWTSCYNTRCMYVKLQYACTYQWRCTQVQKLFTVIGQMSSSMRQRFPLYQFPISTSDISVIFTACAVCFNQVSVI